MNSFKIGDRVIYPNQGRCVIEDIQEELLYGERFSIYHVRLLSNNALILVPLSNTEEMGIRRPVSEEAVTEIFKFMKKKTVDVTTDWKGRHKEHVSLMKSGTIFDIVSVLKSLFYLSQTKPLSSREKKMMEKAKEMIISEISEACSQPESMIEQKIDKTLIFCSKKAKSSLEI